MDRSDQIIFGTFCAALAAIAVIAIAVHNGTAVAAAWAQVIGVPIAIVGSALIATWQYRRTREDETRHARENDERKLGDLVRLVHKILIFVNNLPAWALLASQGRTPLDDVTPDSATVLSWLLYESDFARLDDFAMVSLLADLRARLHRISALLNVEFEGPNISPYVQANRDAAAKIGVRAKADCEDFLRMAQEYKLRGGPPEPPDEN